MDEEEKRRKIEENIRRSKEYYKRNRERILEKLSNRTILEKNASRAYNQYWRLNDTKLRPLLYRRQEEERRLGIKINPSQEEKDLQQKVDSLHKEFLRLSKIAEDDKKQRRNVLQPSQRGYEGTSEDLYADLPPLEPDEVELKCENSGVLKPTSAGVVIIKRGERYFCYTLTEFLRAHHRSFLAVDEQQKGHVFMQLNGIDEYILITPELDVNRTTKFIPIRQAMKILGKNVISLKPLGN